MTNYVCIKGRASNQESNNMQRATSIIFSGIKKIIIIIERILIIPYSIYPPDTFVAPNTISF